MVRSARARHGRVRGEPEAAHLLQPVARPTVGRACRGGYFRGVECVSRSDLGGALAAAGDGCGDRGMGVARGWPIPYLRPVAARRDRHHGCRGHPRDGSRHGGSRHRRRCYRRRAGPYRGTPRPGHVDGVGHRQTVRIGCSSTSRRANQPPITPTTRSGYDRTASRCRSSTNPFIPSTTAADSRRPGLPVASQMAASSSWRERR